MTSDDKKWWFCEKCAATIITHVPLKSAPTCAKHKGHPNMKEIPKPKK